MEFSRTTIIELITALAYLTVAEFDKMLLKFGLDKVAPPAFGTKPKRLNVLAEFLIYNPDTKGPLGSGLVLELIEEEIRRKLSWTLSICDGRKSKVS